MSIVLLRKKQPSKLQIPDFFWKPMCQEAVQECGSLACSPNHTGKAYVAAPGWPMLRKFALLRVSPAFSSSTDGSLADTAAVGAVPELLPGFALSWPSKRVVSAPPWLPKAALSSSPRRTCFFRISAATSRPSPRRSSSGTPSSCPPFPSVSAESWRAGQAARGSDWARTWQGRAYPRE